MSSHEDDENGARSKTIPVVAGDLLDLNGERHRVDAIFPHTADPACDVIVLRHVGGPRRDDLWPLRAVLPAEIRERIPGERVDPTVSGYPTKVVTSTAHLRPRSRRRVERTRARPMDHLNRSGREQGAR